MSDNFWETDEEGFLSEEAANRILEDSISQSDDSSQVKPEYLEEQYEEYAPEEDTEEEEEEDSEADLQVLKDASLRLEQGNLYKMLLKHNLFEGVDADPRAINNVQKEIKSFIRERLEILVGLKTDPKIAKKQPVPEMGGMFSDIEIQLLKQMLSKVTGKKTELTPVQAQPQSAGIRPLMGSAPQRSSPVKVNPNLKKRPVIAKKQQAKPAPVASSKSLSEMTDQEKLARNEAIARAQAQKKAFSPDRAPMPDSNGLMAHHMARVQHSHSHGNGANLLSAIMGKLGKQISLVETVSADSDVYDNNGRI